MATVDIQKWAALVASFAPMILSLFGINPIIGQLISAGIQTEEAVQGAGTGAAKKAAVLTGVADGLTALNASRATTGKPAIGDPTTLSTDVGGAIDLVVSVVNAVHQAAPPVAPPSPGIALPVA